MFPGVIYRSYNSKVRVLFCSFVVITPPGEGGGALPIIPGYNGQCRVVPRLGENRVKEYLISLGVPKSKIQIMARGELSIEADKDHWYRRILDRRVELHVETEQPIKLASARGAVLREAITLDEVAKLLDLDPTDVHKWNGPDHQIIQPGHAIRLYVPVSTVLNPKYFVTEENISEFVK